MFDLQQMYAQGMSIRAIARATGHDRAHGKAVGFYLIIFVAVMAVGPLFRPRRSELGRFTAEAAAATKDR